MAETTGWQCPSCAQVSPTELCPSCPVMVLTQELVDKQNGINFWQCPNCSRTSTWGATDEDVISCEYCPFVAPKEYLRDKLWNRRWFPRTGATGEDIWVEFHCPSCDHFAVHRTSAPKHHEDSRFFQCDKCGRTHEVFPEIPVLDEDYDEEGWDLELDDEGDDEDNDIR